MKTTLRSVALCLFILIGVLPASAATKWLKSLEEAKTVALKENKKILVDFTGSDWCGYCIALDKEVFDKPAFATFAKDYILVKLDFPKSKKLPPSEVASNAKAKEKYQVRGFPSVLVIDPKTDEALAQVTGYSPGSGPAKYLPRLSATKKEGDATPDGQKTETAKKAAKGA